MVLRIELVALCLHLIGAAPTESRTPRPIYNEYTLFDTLYRKSSVVFYPIESLRLARTSRVCSLSDSQSSKGYTNKCCSCKSRLDVWEGELVSPHDGLHWMHVSCYFRQLYKQSMAHKPFICPRCHISIGCPFPTLLCMEYIQPTEDETEECGNTPALFAMTADRDRRRNASALLKDALIVFRNIVNIHRTCKCRNDIFEVVVDLTGLMEESAIVTRIAEETRSALFLDIYTATLIPPSQDIQSNRDLYMKCLDYLENNTNSSFSLAAKIKVYLMIANLTINDLCSSMPQILAVLGISK